MLEAGTEKYADESLGVLMRRPSAILHEYVPVLEVTDPTILTMLLTDPATADQVVRLSDHVVVVQPAALDAVLARLRTLGQTPKIVQGGSDGARTGF